MKPGTLVRYHGTNELYRGDALKVAGLCDCTRCLRWNPSVDDTPTQLDRYRLVDITLGLPAMRCVRPWHCTEITAEMAAAEPCIAVVAAYDNHGR
jgi:hypothetical protein